MKHLTEEELQNLLESPHGVLKNFSSRLHLKNCKDCQAALKRLQEDNVFIKELKDAVIFFNEKTLMDDKTFNELEKKFKNAHEKK